MAKASPSSLQIISNSITNGISTIIETLTTAYKENTPTKTIMSSASSSNTQGTAELRDDSSSTIVKDRWFPFASALSGSSVIVQNSSAENCFDDYTNRCYEYGSFQHVVIVIGNDGVLCSCLESLKKNIIRNNVGEDSLKSISFLVPTMAKMTKHSKEEKECLTKGNKKMKDW